MKLQAGAKMLLLIRAGVHNLSGSLGTSMNRRGTRQEHETLRIDLCQEEKKAYWKRRRRGRIPQCSGAFRLMQRPKTMQRSKVAVELRGW